MKSFAKLGTALLALLFAAACSQSEPGQDSKDEVGKEDKAIYVKTQTITSENIERTLNYTADIKAFKEIYYAPANPGRINKIYVDIGSRVRKGQILAEMDKTQLNQALTQLENARYNFQKIDTLYKLGSISEQNYEQVKTQYELAKSNVAFLKENTRLVSPINGIVTGKYFENGELYSGAPNTQAGKAAIFTLMQINPLKALVSVSQQYFTQLKKGMKVDVKVDIFPDKVFEGTIHKVYPTIDPNTRTFQTEVVITNTDLTLRPGMFGHIEIKLKEEKTLMVPAIAVLKQEGTNNRYIFVNENGTARQIEVTVGKRVDDKVELIANGVQDGMELIIQGQAKLLNGSKIEIKE